METVNVAELVERLGSDEDAVRKMAVFKLQSNIGDPSFADIFIAEGGLVRLRYLTLHASGNTLAYSLTSFSRLLDVDKGWECVDQELVERIVKLIVTHPLVNILRGAMSILVSIVSHPYRGNRASQVNNFGFRALKPAIAIYPQFLEMLVSRLSSADHALCANALQLINSLMRDSITHDPEAEWPKFIQKLQDLGVIRAVYVLMQDSVLQDLTHPLLEFQSLTKVLLRKWRDIPVNQERPEHRRALKGIYLASNPEKNTDEATENGEDTRRSRRHHPEKWRRLGFETESPAGEFYEVGFLGMMDLADYVRSHGDEFQKMLLEHSTKPSRQRCPIARASLAVTSILYEHFEVEKSDMDDTKTYLISESRAGFDKLFQPLLLHWTRLHVAGLQAFFRLWKATAAEEEDLDKIIELVRILIESVVGGAARIKDVQDVEEELADFEYHRLRGLQMELLELTYEDAWGQHLRQVREELHHEALQFVKEQRIRSLLQGSWFALDSHSKPESGSVHKSTATYQYAQLSHNRRYLHFGQFNLMGNRAPELDTLPEKIDLSIVSSVVSNVSTNPDHSSTSTVKTAPRQPATKITIHGYAASTATGHGKNHTHARSSSRTTQKEIVLLTLRPSSHSIASEWLDGLLMLLNQQPITAETSKLIDLVSNYGLKIRLLNVRFDDATFAGLSDAYLNFLQVFDQLIMDGRPPKRQRKSKDSKQEPKIKSKRKAAPVIISDSSSPIEPTEPFTLSSRPKSSYSRGTTPSTRLPSSSPSPNKRTKSSPNPDSKSKSLHSFFQPATEGQRWAPQKAEKQSLPPVRETVDEDLIEDDYDSYDEIFTQHLANERAATGLTAASSSQTRQPAPKQKPKAPVKPPRKTTKRFILSTGSVRGPTKEPLAAQTASEPDRRPWAQRFAPANLGELAVHKKKVSDVQHWLEDAFAGRRSERLLVLRGPAGSGKTTTVSLLSELIGYDIVEWKNPPVSEFGAHDYQSVSAHFEEFLGRGDKFGGLDLENANELDTQKDEKPRDHRILLIEEFPTVFGRVSSALTAFRASLQRYLAASATDHPRGSSGSNHPPIVIIVSETLLGSASSISDNLTVHRLLGPTIYNHPGTTILDFNSIAPTFMHKALRSILDREAQNSGRAQIPGPGVIDSISEIGDIRSAISSLEFLCLKGDDTGRWGGSVAKTKKARGEVALTAMEKESLKMITQREASLGMFHAVGKIVYNKRMDPSLIEGDVEILPPPPEYLRHYARPKASQVLVNDLVDETGTDISTFVSALHENYVPSCDGDDFTDYFNNCIDALSDSDILSADRRPGQGARAGIGTGITSFGSGVDVLRQEEMSFQVAARGLLFALPYPVKRRVGSGTGRSRAGDAYKMFYPASLRLWREAEEIDGLIDSWMNRSLDPFGQRHLSRNGSDLTGVSSWKNLQVGRSASGNSGKKETTSVVTMMPRHDFLLHQLPYMAIIRRQDPDCWQLDKITNIRTNENLRNDEMNDMEESPAQSRMKQPSRLPEEEEKLILSDDDIVD
ncbi:Engulfment/cell motility, ELMO [Penicillium italicum]|uniref:Engulfment/cell motility, ELMO n=1 Tax=Penicillium italicum TaxID=40296 RepID=A0A0A2KI78_PENIT|nr:Engulfment/cell motility, ELMO [Penicillium italicum]